MKFLPILLQSLQLPRAEDEADRQQLALSTKFTSTDLSRRALTITKAAEPRRQKPSEPTLPLHFECI